MSHRTVAGAALALFSLALWTSAPAGALDYGTAQGSLLVGGERHDLNHAYALPEGSVYERGGGGDKAITHVLLLDREGDPAAIVDAKRRAKALSASGAHGVLIRIHDQSGDVQTQTLLLPGGTAEVAGDEHATWLRGEFTNRVVWGALASEGQLAGDPPWRYEAIFAGEFTPPRAGTLDENAAEGTFQIGSRSAQLAHARAFLETSEAEPEKTHTVVVLSSAPVDLATARDAEALRAAVKSAKLTAIKVWISDQEGVVTRQEWFAPQTTQHPETVEGLRWAGWDFTTDKIRGFLSTDGTKQVGRTRWQLDAHFAAPIEGVPPANEEGGSEE
jgi:hypothetical protein